MKRPSDKEVLESLCAKNAEVRWWHFVPFVGLGMCALEDARFKARARALRRSKPSAKGVGRGA